MYQNIYMYVYIFLEITIKKIIMYYEFNLILNKQCDSVTIVGTLYYVDKFVIYCANLNVGSKYSVTIR
jgi:hypothetical protein